MDRSNRTDESEERMSVRSFIAIELDDPARGELAEEVAYLKSHFPKVRWVAPEALHVTLAFLGELDENDLEPVCDLMRETCEAMPAFTLDIAGLGCFPNARAPRVVWAGCGLGRDETCGLARALREGLAELGLEPDRRAYNPHVTLGRVKAPGDAAGLETILADASQVAFGEVDVDGITLFMSERKRSGPRYSPMFRADLPD
jgi:RNA 2',3'-cyclic 3'-phosphodiesterase